jgi:hypothetical protein
MGVMSFLHKTHAEALEQFTLDALAQHRLAGFLQQTS